MIAKQWTAPLIAAMLSVSFGLPVIAQDETTGVSKRGMGHMRQMLGQLDRDGDGVITKSEYIRSHEAMFEQMDQDGDDVLGERDLEGVTMHDCMIMR